jgi:hypothetical protein
LKRHHGSTSVERVASEGAPNNNTAHNALVNEWWKRGEKSDEEGRSRRRSDAPSDLWHLFRREGVLPSPNLPLLLLLTGLTLDEGADGVQELSRADDQVPMLGKLENCREGENWDKSEFGNVGRKRGAYRDSKGTLEP